MKCRDRRAAASKQDHPSEPGGTSLGFSGSVGVLPGNPPMPCPELLTEEEAIRYLRLDETGIEDPSRTLRYYREQGLLRATQVGRRLRYRRIELDRLLDRLTETNPR